MREEEREEREERGEREKREEREKKEKRGRQRTKTDKSERSKRTKIIVAADVPLNKSCVRITILSLNTTDKKIHSILSSCHAHAIVTLNFYSHPTISCTPRFENVHA